jgi:hypothetical protein
MHIKAIFGHATADPFTESLFFRLVPAAPSDPARENSTLMSGLKKILLFNSFFGRSDFYFGFGHTVFRDNCRVSDCYVTNDHNLLGESGRKRIF